MRDAHEAWRNAHETPSDAREATSDIYDLAALETALAGTVFAGKLHYAATTGSTNTDAQAAARAGAEHGSVWFADEQTAGRGRSDHAWDSTAGEGLYVSVVLRPRMEAARLPLLPLAAGLAAAEAIHAVTDLSVDLRWPNDLLLPHSGQDLGQNINQASRKVGGILAEARTKSGSAGGAVDFAVVGIGINVHQQVFAPDLATPATSLDLEAGHRVSRQALLAALLKSLQREAVGLADREAGTMISARLERASTWMRGRQVEVHGPQACTGITAGLDEHGFLRVQTASGLVTVQTGGIRADPCGGADAFGP